MTYRLTAKAVAQRKKLEAMRIGRERARMARPLEERAPDLPDLRREIIIIDHDFGERMHRLALYKTDRVDCYRVEVDGRPWKNRIGWSAILAGLRKSMPRVGAA